MTETALRKKLHDCIDALPTPKLAVLEPLLSNLADDYWKPVIEPASPEESARAKKILRELETNPDSFVPFVSAKSRKNKKCPRAH